MKVILEKDVKALGKKGNVVEVSDGYARNYLFPKNLAVEASNSNINVLNQQKAAEKSKKQKEMAVAKELESSIAKLKVTIKAKAGENGRLFGSITAKDVADALKEQHGIDIDKKKIVMNDAIKSLGTTVLNVKLYEGITGKLKVEVIEI